MRKLNEVYFREFYNKFVFIKNSALMHIILGDRQDGVSGMVAYCYIDEEEGLAFRGLYKAGLDESGLKLGLLPDSKENIYLVRLRSKDKFLGNVHIENNNLQVYSLDYTNTEFIDIEKLGFDVNVLEPIRKEMTDIYGNSTFEDLRGYKYSFLDKFRDEYYPDRVYVYLINARDKIERNWIGLTGANGKDSFTGKLLREPSSEFENHKGDVIQVKYVNDQLVYMVNED